ncbi:hypothetical protein Hanom_Chr17g01533981 [Helianthus anomalus]
MGRKERILWIRSSGKLLSLSISTFILILPYLESIIYLYFKSQTIEKDHLQM